MNILGLTLGLPAIAISVMLTTLPIWAAAKIVNAGRQDFGRVAGALVLATLLVILVAQIAGGWTLLLAPLIVILTFSKLLETSYTGAFVLCVLALAFMVAMSKLFSWFA